MRELKALFWLFLAAFILVFAWVINAAEPSVVARVYTMPDCPPCHRMERECRRDLPSYSMAVGREVVFEDYRKSPTLIRSTPTTIIYRDGKAVFRRSGYMSPKQLADAYGAVLRK